MRHAYIKLMFLWGFEESLRISLGTSVMGVAHEVMSMFMYIYLYIYVLCMHIYT
jgi:hypothetical protein